MQYCLTQYSSIIPITNHKHNERRKVLNVVHYESKAYMNLTPQEKHIRFATSDHILI